jgi:hypothetical protein
MIDASGNKEERRTQKLELAASTKIKQLRQLIKDQLAIKEKVSIKLYLPVNEEAKPVADSNMEETKEGDTALEQLLAPTHPTEDGFYVLVDDKQSLKDAGILSQPDKIEVEIVIKLQIDVQGKGKDYAATLEVSADDQIQTTLQSKLNFFKTFY